MKRRNVDCGKLRRPVKRSKIAEGIYGSTFLYVKFLMVWALVLMADFILDFRFEYLWPFWLMLRSVYDSFKYQGMAFSVFFVCIAITSDVICYLFIPVQWLFFAASTYVWVQYVWHTDRGICLPTVSLWLLFVYIEASVRLREFKSLPFHLDLCRPFAAHCIGYPVVTLGFGFKSYVSYKLRIRRQKDVQKENDFYLQLLQRSLPSDQHCNSLASENKKVLPSSKVAEEIISNGISHSSKKTHTGSLSNVKVDSEMTASSTSSANSKKQIIDDFDSYIEQTPPPGRRANVNDYDETEQNNLNESSAKAYKTNSISSGNQKSVKLNPLRENGVVASSGGGGKKVKTNNTRTDSYNTANNNVPVEKDTLIGRLENDIKRLKADLQISRNTEQDMRGQIASLSAGDKNLKSENYQLKQDNETLQTKLHNLVTSRQQDKQNLLILEKKLQDERRCKAVVESQLGCERKAKKAEEAAAARAVAMAAAVRDECTERCKSHQKDLENDMMQLRRDLMMREDAIRRLEHEAQSLRQYKDAQNETEVLMSALAAMQDKNNHLESSLSAETRIKMDLFSALGEAKRQIEIKQDELQYRDKECQLLKARIAEVMALVPSNSCTTSTSCAAFTTANSMILAAQQRQRQHQHQHQHQRMSPVSTLNPNASDYTPVQIQ